MMVNAEQIYRGFSQYFEAEFCQKASGVGQFAAYFMLPSADAFVRKKYEEFRNTDLLADIINEDGLLDLDRARDRAETAMQHCGGFNIAGFNVGVSDVDALYKAIRDA